MFILDRYLIRRFITNFVILFVLIYLLATAIDIILQLDEFTRAAHSRAGEDASLVMFLSTFTKLTFSYHGPRFFQLYAYLAGLVAVGAMGFTVAQMQRNRELLAILASGMSLFRVAWPIVVAAFVLNLLHLVNSNIILPKLAPALVQSHGDLETEGETFFPIPLTKDGRGAILHAPAYNQDTQYLTEPTFIRRNARGTTTERITADAATWNDAVDAWELKNGKAMIRIESGNPDAPDQIITQPSDRFQTDLSPKVLVVRRYKEFAQMLSPQQIQEMIETGGAVDTRALARIKFGRYSVVISNVLMLIICLPFFLTREPGSLLKRSMMCAGVAVLAMLGTFVGMEVPFQGLSPAASVFSPVIILLPLALASLSFVKT